MRKRKILNLPMIFVFIFSFIDVSGQSPSFDKNWSQNAAKSDEFNYDVFPLWGKYYVIDGSKGNGISSYSNRDVNLFMRDNDIAVLKVLNDNYLGAPYSCVFFETRDLYSYGYFESKIKLPKGDGFHLAFWLYNGSDAECWYNEVDILEPYGTVMGECKTMGTNLHTFNNFEGYQNCSSSASLSYDAPQDITGLPDLSADWHIYGCEWLPDRVIWYFDNKIVRIKIKDSELIPRYQQKVAFDVDVDYTIPDLSKNEMQVDYFKYYELNMDCNTTVNADNFDFSNYYYAVKKSYSLSNSIVPTGIATTLRATDFIQLNQGFEVPANTEFNAVVTPCY